MLFETPIISNKNVVEKLNVTAVTANKLVIKFEEIGILTEITGKKRYKKYLFEEYVDIISRGTNNI
jgi:Fic family protein